MDKKLKIVHLAFLKHFGYPPKFPNEINFNQNEYADLLQKCMDDNFDYTIEKYGTNSNFGTKPHNGVYID